MGVIRVLYFNPVEVDIFLDVGFMIEERLRHALLF